MFSVLTADSLHQVHRKKLRQINAGPVATYVPQRQIKVANIVGARARSRSGCTFCKKRRRKCTEERPACALCTKTGTQCVYKDAADVPGPREVAAARIEPKMEIRCPKEGPSPQRAPTAPVVQGNTKKVPQSFPLLTAPSSTLSLLVGPSERFYIHYFQTHVTHELCFTNTNYFSKVFCLLANNEESFAYIIAAWGALYYNGKRVDHQISQYLYQSVVKFHHRFESDNNRLGLYFKICYYLITVGFHVCTGDTTHWRSFLEACKDTIQKLGGLKMLAESFGYTDDVRFLVSNFQYHDIMSSSSSARGKSTLFPMEEYVSLFESEPFVRTELAYGIDDLQGCNHPILSVYGETLKLKASAGTGCSLEHIRDLEQRIETVQPHPQLILGLEPSEQVVHLKAFELYRLCCKLNMAMYVVKKTPADPEIQHLRTSTLQLVEELVSTRFKVVICLPLLLCGMCSTSDEDKLRLSQLFDTIMQASPVLNVSRCWKIVQTAWEMEGELAVDWTDVCEGFGWDLNVC